MAQCPIDGCEYTDTAECVEAHVSGKQDPEHRGKSGFQYRDEIRESDEGRVEAAEATTVAGEVGEEEAIATSEEGEPSGDSEGDSEGVESVGDESGSEEEAVATSEEGEPSGDSEGDSKGQPSLAEEDRADLDELEVDVENDGESDDDEPPSAGGVAAVEDATAKARSDGLSGFAVVLATVGLIAVVLLNAGGSSSSEQPEASADGGEGESSTESDAGGYDELWGE